MFICYYFNKNVKEVCIMYAERLILETDQSGHLKEPPILPANKQFEVIFLGLDNENKLLKRKPHPDIIGKIEFFGDVFESAPLSEWNFTS